MACPDEIQDCELLKLGDGQLFRKLLRIDENGCLYLNVKTVGGGEGEEVTLSSTERVYTRELVTVAGSVAAGSRHITLETSEDFTGTIGGVIAYPNRNYEINVRQNDDTIGAVTYEIITGSIIINKLV